MPSSGGLFVYIASKAPKRRFLSKAVKPRSEWKSVVGLEVHAQIATESKLFSGASTSFSSPVNSNVSLFDAATPGTLPVLNRKCVEAGLLTALALNCIVSPVSYFDRKHYFYADMPSGYQITQQRAPLASKGHLAFDVYSPGTHKSPYKVQARLKQLQLEQDSGKSLHDTDRSLVDLNRAGAPLMELVFEPDLADGEEAAASFRLFGFFIGQGLRIVANLHYSLGLKGALRVDANVSIHKPGEPLGTRTEIKNIGSVRGVAGAIKYEIQRQISLLEENGTVVNETRSWDPTRKLTVAMRDKELLQDYRYMPEPNLPPLHVAMGPIQSGTLNVDAIRERIPELPEQTRQRLGQSLGLNLEQCIILVNDSDLLRMFETVQQESTASPQKLANFLINELKKALHKMDLETSDVNFRPEMLGEIVEMLEAGTINMAVAEMVLDQLLQGSSDRPLQIVESKGWKQITDEEELRLLCSEVLQENEKAVKAFLGGKAKVFKAFLGPVYKKSNGRADMKKCGVLLRQLLSDIASKRRA